MATSQISGADLTLLRSNQHISDIALHITPLQVVQSGTITAIPTLSPYVDVTWDGATTNIAIGQMVKITNGTTLKTYGVIRKAPSGSTLYISATPLGSAGIATRIENAIAVNDTVTVYNHMPIWNVFSRIADGVFYKSWDIPYTNQNSQPHPVCNTGAWQVAKLASGVTTHTFTLPRNGVNTSFALGSATITSYLWTLPAGVTFATGYSATDSVVNVDAIAGTYQVSCLLTDSNGATHTAYMWLFVSDGVTGTSLSERYPITLDSDNQTRKGREISFTIIGDNLQDVIYPSAGIVLKDWTVFGGSSLSDNVPIDTFIGYISHDGLSFTHDGNVGKATVKAVSPFIYAEKVGQPLQVLEEVTSPSHWAQCTSALSNPRGYLYYSMAYHAPNILSMHDLDSDHTTPRRQFADFNTNNLAASMQVSALYIAANLGSASDGSTVLRLNPMLMSNADRNALDVVIAWQEQDIIPNFGYDKRIGGGAFESRIGAFAYDGSKTKAWLAGKRWGQGVSTTTAPNISVTIAEGVDRLKAVSGHILAEQNADIQGITIELNAFQDVIDPVYMLWNRLNISATFDPNGVGFANERMLPSQVARTWELTNNGWMKRIALTLQPETYGQAGEEIPIGSATTWLQNGMSASLPTQHNPPQGDNALNGVGMMIAHDDNGKFAICYDTTATSLNYTDLSSSVNNETVNDWTIDWNSAYFNNGNDITKAISVYAITTSGTSLNVWYFADILNNTVASIIHTYTMSDSSCTSEARIECSETTPTYVGVGWHDQTGTEFGYSSDGGATFSAKANVGSTITDTANDNAPLGMDIDGNVTIISAPDSTPEYGMYKATSVGGAFSVVTNTERTSAPQPMAKIEPDGTVAYVSTTGSGVATSIAPYTFDTGGNTDYTLIGANSGIGTGVGMASDFSGISGDAAQAAPVGTPATNELGVKSTFGSSKTIITGRFDAYTKVLEASGEETDFVLYNSSGVELDRLGGVSLNILSANKYLRLFMPAIFPSFFPRTDTALEVRLEYHDGVSSATDLRLDNIEYSDVEPQGSLVDFDSGHAYTTGVSANWILTEPASGGNPDSHLKADPNGASVNTGDYFYIEVNLGSSKTITGIQFDLQWNYNRIMNFGVYVGGVLQDTEKRIYPIITAHLGTWVRFDVGSMAFSNNDLSPFPVTGQVIQLRFISANGSTVSSNNLLIDNITFEHATTGANSELFSVDPITGSAVWTDITPATDEAPERPHDLSIGLIDNQVIDCVSGTSNNWYTSLNGGTSWSTSEAASDKRAFLTAGETALEGGDGEIKISFDSGATFEDLTGNLASVWGGVIGIIKRIFAL